MLPKIKYIEKHKALIFSEASVKRLQNGIKELCMKVYQPFTQSRSAFSFYNPWKYFQKGIEKVGKISKT